MCSHKRTKAVANFFINKAKEENMRDFTVMKALKITYVAHGWNLAINNEPLIDDKVLAWKYGPVIPSIYHSLRIYANTEILLPILNSEEYTYIDATLNPEKLIDEHKIVEDKTISTDTINLMEAVWNKYKHLSGWELSLMTHEYGTPWQKVFNGANSTEISENSIKEHFIALGSRQ